MTAEALKQFQVPPPRNVVQQLADRPDHLEVSILPTQEQVKQVCEIALDFTPDANLEYSIDQLGQISHERLDAIPPVPVLWMHAVEIASRNAGMLECHAGIFSLRTLETVCQLVGIEVAESAIPTVLHPIVAGSAVSGSDEDQRAIWVRMAHKYPETGPPEWLASTYQFMAGFTMADPDFQLYDMHEWFSLVQLLNKSLDVCDDPTFS